MSNERWKKKHKTFMMSIVFQQDNKKRDDVFIDRIPEVFPLVSVSKNLNTGRRTFEFEVVGNRKQHFMDALRDAFAACEDYGSIEEEVACGC
jgi:hypothetical protein